MSHYLHNIIKATESWEWDDLVTSYLFWTLFGLLFLSFVFGYILSLPYKETTLLDKKRTTKVGSRYYHDGSVNSFQLVLCTQNMCLTTRVNIFDLHRTMIPCDILVEPPRYSQEYLPQSPKHSDWFGQGVGNLITKVRFHIYPVFSLNSLVYYF